MAIAGSLLASLLRVSMNPFWGTGYAYIFFYPMTLLVALLGGLGPGLVSIAICAVAAAIFIVPIDTGPGLLAQVTYVMVSAWIAWISAAHRTALHLASRQAETNRLREEFRSLIEDAPTTFAIFDTNMRYIAASRRFLEAYRLTARFGTPAELIGLSHYEVFPEIPEHWREVHRHCLAGATERADQDPFRREDGRTDWIRWEIRPWRRADGKIGGVVLYSEVITDRVEAEAALRRSEEQFRAVVETTSDAILVTDVRGKITLVNAQTERVFGYDRAELIGQAVEILVPTRWRQGHVSHRADFAAHPQRRMMGAARALFGRRKDGSEVPIEIGLGAFGAGDDACVSAVVRDISERKRLEAQIEASRVQAIASARLSAIGTMAGGIAHEINNPLAVIHALARDLLEAAEAGDMAPGEPAESAREIAYYSERIAKIVRSLRHIARDGEKDPFAEASVSDIVDHALDICAERFREHSIDLQTNPIDPRLRVMCREVQISQVLLNLLQNAFDAVQEQAGEKWVRVKAAAQGDDLMLSVEDSGKGIAPELKARVMEPFFTTKPVGKGTGLGLSLSKQLAEEHGGALEVSEAGGHTCFSLRLPLARRATAACG